MSTPQPAFRIDAQPCSQAAFYAAACDPARNVVVQACAGAGKTWMLVSRVLRALLGGAQGRQILAITFTRKAAGEMRARLNEWLTEFAAPNATHDARIEALCQRGLDAASAQRLAPALAGLQERLLREGDAVEVRTFHGWFIQLMTNAPLELLNRLGLRAQMQFIEDASELHALALRRFLRRVAGEAALAQDYRQLVLEHRRSTVQSWLRAALAKPVEINLADAAGTLQDGVVAPGAWWPGCAGLADVRELVHAAGMNEAVAAAAAALSRSHLALARQAAAELLAAQGLADSSAAFAALWAAAFTKKDEPRKLGELPAHLALCAELTFVAHALVQQQARASHLRMVRLSRVLLAEFAALKRERGVADMDDVEAAALALLNDPQLSGWVQERLDLRTRHLLIDEFQDTSPLQWHALHAWLSGYAGAGGGQGLSVFIVGDPKQSIYRFRRAEPRVFTAAREFVVDALAGTVLECDHTRRNQPAVVAAVNAVFAGVAQRESWQDFHPHTTAAQGVGRAGLLPCESRVKRAPRGHAAQAWRDTLATPRHDPELQARAPQRQQLAAWLAHGLHAGQWLPGEVMVLARQRKALLELAEELAALGLPHALPAAGRLADAPEVQDLLALLDVLASPGHDLSLARALKSPLFGADDAQLLWLAQQARGARQSWSAALHAAAPGSLPQPLARAQAHLERWRQAMPQLPPHDLLDRIVADTDLPARLAACVPPARRGAALRSVRDLLATALELDGARYATPYGFVRALRQRPLPAPEAPASGAIQLLTVHGAKGLEARLVVVMDADGERLNPARATLLVDWPVHLAHPQRVAFIASEGRVPPSLQEAFASELTERRREELNGLYVAMTRAREQLAFSATPAHSKTELPSWWDLAAAQLPTWPAPPAAQALLAGTPLPLAWIEQLPLLNAAAVAAPAPPLAAEPLGGGHSAALGEAVHRLLEWAGQPGAQAWSAADLERAAAAAAAQFGLQGAGAGGGAGSGAAQVLSFSRRILGSPAARRFFSATQLAWAGNEVAVVEGGEPLRIDRLVALAGAQGREWWVLDYKLATLPQEQAELRAQMQRYRRAVMLLQPGEVVRAAFITGQGEVVEVD